MKLIIQIPCYNEEASLPDVLKGLPKKLPGIDQIEVVVIDDGSQDQTASVARALGVHYVVQNKKNIGLAHSFRIGLDRALREGADIVVNLDGDNQYCGAEIGRVIEPIIAGRADLVIGCRDIDNIPHFSPFKRLLQKLGTFVVSRLAHIGVGDATSGFRAFSRKAALQLNILSNYTYTLESILQVASKGIALTCVPISVNAPVRPSRLMKNLWSYLVFSLATMIRIFTMYNPLSVFLPLGLLVVLVGLSLVGRFMYFYFVGSGAGHVQSLVVAVSACLGGFTVILIGLIADLIQFNRRMLEEVLERVRRLELDWPPPNKK